MFIFLTVFIGYGSAWAQVAEGLEIKGGGDPKASIQYDLASEILQLVVSGASSAVSIYTGGSPRLHILNSGEVGVGTLSPDVTLEVNGPVKGSRFQSEEYCNADGSTCLTHEDLAASGSGGEGEAPAGAVMAFDLEECPDGWSPYVSLSGRFVRGKCLDGEDCHDEDGMRAIGSVQEDEFKSHRHNTGLYTNYSGGSGFHGLHPGSSGSQTGFAGGDETRPRNVALLYCRKD